MRIRPHHLLCTQGYSGKGYSPDFVRNMTEVTTHLRDETDAVVDLVFTTDDICICCPNQVEPGRCDKECKVHRFDRKTVEYFGLEEGSYRYWDLLRVIRAHITEEILADICAGCEWYPISACRRKILGVP